MLQVKDYNIINDGSRDTTKELQKLLDLAQNDTLIINEGTYLVSNLYVKSNTTLVFEANACLLATTDEGQYDIRKTRVAGINMEWYLAVLNIIDQKNVHIIGGLINGNGPYWWNKYWGEDKKGGMRKIYDDKNLRWACDYDCKRIRNVLIQNSENVTISNLTSYLSGFWNIHVLYSSNVVLNNIKVETIDVESPSTDGIDIDSSHNVTVKNCNISCFDDSICIKSGRDYDGIMTNIPSYNINIHDCILKKGYGITIGSEVSGGIYNVNIENIKYIDTDCGFRIKSSFPRKGYIKDIFIENLDMLNVKYLFNLYLNWNPNYSICKKNNDEILSDYLEKLCNQEFSNLKNTEVSNIYISNVVAKIDSSFKGNSRIFNILGFSDSVMKNINIKNVSIKANEYGIIKFADVAIKGKMDYEIEHNPQYDLFDNR